jgi:hypothetical protein
MTGGNPPKGAAEARNQLSDLLKAAEQGRSTSITRHGRSVGKNSASTIEMLREEWSRWI